MSLSAHWLRGNASEWSPRFVGFFDTETFPVRTGEDREELRLRLWVAGIVDRRPEGKGKSVVCTDTGTTREGLARWVARSMVGKPNLWLFAHNLGFDLTVSRLPDYLHRQGWELGDFRFAGRNVTGHLRKRSKSLWLVDSTSWLPHALAKVGHAVGRRKLAMPAVDAPEEAWVEYCTGDVLVLADAVLTCMDWWDREHLGHWTKSGPGCGWNAARHVSRSKLFLIRPEVDQVKHDRRAVYGGRRDVTRVGEIEGGPFALIDFSDAYLTVCAHLRTPKGRYSWHDFDLGEVRRLAQVGYGAVAECEISTAVPRYPLRTSQGVFYPVGRFRTWLASPEITAADEAGDLISVGGGFVHDTGFPLQAWAHRALAWLDPADESVPAVVRMMVKQWGRSVPGRFAMRTSKTLWSAPATWPGWHLERGTSGPDHLPAVNVHLAGRQWWSVQDQEGENSYPAVLAWIESHVRVRLNRMLEELGEGLWVACDTDGLVVNLEQAPVWLAGRLGRRWRSRDPLRTARAVCDVLAAFTAPLVPRVKVLSETLTVAGPQHYSGDTFSRAAGRPGKPEVDDQGELHHWSWPKVAWQMEHGSPDGYVRVERSWTEPAVTAHRWVAAGGVCLPVLTETGAGSVSVLAPWSRSGGLYAGVELGPVQSPALHGLY